MATYLPTPVRNDRKPLNYRALDSSHPLYRHVAFGVFEQHGHAVGYRSSPIGIVGAPGLRAGTMDFSGASGPHRYEYGATGTITPGPFTVACRVYLDSFGNQFQGICNLKVAGETENWKLLGSSNTSYRPLSWGQRTGSFVKKRISEAANHATGAWVDYVISYPGTGVVYSVWRDGVSQTITNTGTFGVETSDQQIGSWSSTNTWTGAIDYVVVLDGYEALNPVRLRPPYIYDFLEPDRIDLFPSAGGALGGPIGIASEADSALGLSSAKARALGLVADAETALPMSVSKARAIGIASEADSALSAGRHKTLAIGQAIEADAALAMSASLAALGLPVETDAALPMSVLKTRAIGIVSDSSSALGFTAVKLRNLGIATESSAAFAMGRTKLIGLGLVTETDSALAITGSDSVAAASLGYTLTSGPMDYETPGAPLDFTVDRGPFDFTVDRGPFDYTLDED